MNTPQYAASGRAGISRPSHRRHLALTGLNVTAVAALAVTAGCTSHPTAGQDSGAAATVRSLGAVPIPSPPTAQATPSADEQHLQLVAMGAPVRASLPGVTAVVVASGPTQDVPSAGGKALDHTRGTITITISDATGPVTVNAADVTSRDDQGQDVVLSPVGVATVTATAGHPATLTVAGTFHAGAAQLTWRHDGNVVAIWDFNIELD